MKAKPIQIWGYLWMKDHQEICLDGIVPNSVEPNNIVSFGQYPGGDEVNVYVIRDDGSDELLTTMEEVKAFFQKLKDSQS